MNFKLSDKFISILSAIMFIYTFATSGLFNFGIKETTNHIDIFRVLVAVFVALLIIIVFLYKRSYVNLYETLCTMAENNKLHPIRARVMVTYKNLKKQLNPFKIKHANFKYTFLPSKENSDKIDIVYSLKFDIEPTLYSVLKYKIFKKNFVFYIITNDTSNFEIKECWLTFNNGEKQNFLPVIHDVTTKGRSEDRIRTYSGLNEINISYPNKVRSKDKLSYHISYICRDNLTTMEERHSFVIMPENYATKIDSIDIVLEGIGVELSKIELQEFYQKNINIVSLFQKLQIEPITQYKLLEKIIPRMDACYFTQFDYKIR